MKYYIHDDWSDFKEYVINKDNSITIINKEDHEGANFYRMGLKLAEDKSRISFPNREPLDAEKGDVVLSFVCEYRNKEKRMDFVLKADMVTETIKKFMKETDKEIEESDAKVQLNEKIKVRSESKPMLEETFPFTSEEAISAPEEFTSEQCSDIVQKYEEKVGTPTTYLCDSDYAEIVRVKGTNIKKIPSEYSSIRRIFVAEEDCWFIINHKSGLEEHVECVKGDVILLFDSCYKPHIYTHIPAEQAKGIVDFHNFRNELRNKRALSKGCNESMDVCSEPCQSC